MAISSRAEWFAVYVETPDHLKLSETGKNRLFKTIGLAERLGAEIITLSGTSIPHELIHFARTRNATRIVVGKSIHGGLQHLKDLIFGSLVDNIIRMSGDIDVYVITGDPLPGETIPHPRSLVKHRPKLVHYLYVCIIVAFATLVDHLLFNKLREVSLAMIYLLSIIFCATRFDRDLLPLLLF